MDNVWISPEEAIEALRNSSEKPNGSDLISIQMAIEHWGRSSGNLTNDQIAELQREIESLPSADRPTGKWEEVGTFKTIDDVTIHVLRCKECGALYRTRQYEDGKYANANYCPNCGSYNREDREKYELATEQMEHDAMHEPTYNSEDGSM